MKLRGIAVLISIFVAFVGIGMTGCEYFPESTFQLAPDSRLPKWITLPPGIARTQVSIEMNYYSNLWGSDTTFVLRDAKHQTLRKIYGKVKCNEPILIKGRTGETGYPSYQVITVNGMSEIVEHKKMEPKFYISDDPIVWNAISAGGCG
jgi:hypothetical protein